MAESATQEDTAEEQVKTGRCGGEWQRWMILTGLFLVSFLEVGSGRTLSLFLDDLTFQFGVSTSYLGAIYGLVAGMAYLLALINVPLLRLFSVRQLTIFGGSLTCIGLVAASYTRTASQLTIALITYGLGYVFIILPTNSCPADYFPDRFEIATGIFVSGGSVGVMIMPWLFETLINEYGWRGGLLLLAGFNAQFCVIGSLLKPTGTQSLQSGRAPSQDGQGSGVVNANFEPDELCNDIERRDEDINYLGTELHERQTELYNGETVATKMISTRHIQVDDGGLSNNQLNEEIDVKVTADINTRWSCLWISSTAKFFKARPMMLMVCILKYLFVLPYGTWLLFTIPNALAKGLTALRATQLSIAGGIANFFCRFTGGFITSRKLARIEVWYMIANFISATAFFINYVAGSFWSLLILSLFIGYTVGFMSSAQFTLTMKAVGQEYFKTGLAILFVCSGSSFPILGFIAGAIFDATQSYNIAFSIMGALDALAALLIISPLAWERFCKRTSN